MIHKAAKELKNVKIIHKNLPLDTECNKYLQQPFHVGACQMARYALAAEKQGKFWDINSLFFEKQPNTDEEILKIAEKIGLDTEKLQKDAESFEVKNKSNMISNLEQQKELTAHRQPLSEVQYTWG